MDVRQTFTPPESNRFKFQNFIGILTEILQTNFGRVNNWLLLRVLGNVNLIENTRNGGSGVFSVSSIAAPVNILASNFDGEVGESGLSGGEFFLQNRNFL